MANKRGRKTAIVTGGGGAIGGTISATLAENGYDLAIWDLDEATAHATAERVEENGGRATVHRVDLTDDRGIDGAAGSTRDAHGSIDVIMGVVDMWTEPKPPVATIGHWR